MFLLPQNMSVTTTFESDSCKRVGLVFDTTISCVEAVNSQSVQIQVWGALGSRLNITRGPGPILLGVQAQYYWGSFQGV